MPEMDALPIDCSVPDAEPRMASPMRTNTEASVISGNLLLSDLLSGSGDVRFQGSCPRCHHWHERAILRLARLPQRFNGVRCENCDYKWFGLGGNSTHTSLISQETMSISQIGNLPQKEDLDAFLDKPHLTSLVERIHPFSAVASPFATLAVSPNRSRGSSVVSRTSSRKLRHRSSPNSRARSTEAERSTSDIRERLCGDFDVPTGAYLDRKKRSRPMEIASNLKAKWSSATRRLHLPDISRSLRSRSPRHSSSEEAPEEMTYQVPRDGEDNQSMTTPPGQPNEETHLNSLVQPPETQQDQDRSPDQIASDPPSNQADTEEPVLYQAPIRSGEAKDSTREDHIKDFRNKWTDIKARQCDCGDQCHCKRPSSSIIPDNPLSDGASVWHMREQLYPLDLAEPSRSRIDSTSPRLGVDFARPIDLAFIGYGLPSNPRGSSSSLFSIGSMGTGRTRNSRRMTPEHPWRFSFHDSQAETAVSESNRSSLSARSISLPRQPGLRPTSISRGPSPLAAPSYPHSQEEAAHSNRGPSDSSFIDADNVLSLEPVVTAGLHDGVPSPIQEATAPNSEHNSMHELAFVGAAHAHVQTSDADANDHDNVSSTHIHIGLADSPGSSVHSSHDEDDRASSNSKDNRSRPHYSISNGPIPSFDGPLNSHLVQ